MQLHIANEAILHLDIAQESRALSEPELELLRDLKHQVLGWAAIERSRCRQSSRLTQIKEEDACTKFFYQRANGRRKRNLIAYLKTLADSIVWGHDEKEDIQFQFFSELLGTKAERTQVLDWNRLQLCTVDDEDMDRPFCEEEVEYTIRMMPAEKAPGPDGFTGSFYERCWQTIKWDRMWRGW